MARLCRQASLTRTNKPKITNYSCRNYNCAGNYAWTWWTTPPYDGSRIGLSEGGLAREGYLTRTARCAYRGCGTCLVVTAMTQASAAAAAPSIRSAMRYCFTEIAKIHPPQPASRVVFQTCSRQHAPGSLLPAGLSPQRLSTVVTLVTFYQNAGWTGRRTPSPARTGHAILPGMVFPTCASSSPMFRELARTNSTTIVNCELLVYTNFNGHGHGAVTGNIRYVGATWNDHLWSMRTWA